MKKTYDNLLVGDIEDIYETIETFKENGLVFKILKGLKDYLSFEVRFLMNEKSALFG